jgi:hypothetical protein
MTDFKFEGTMIGNQASCDPRCTAKKCVITLAAFCGHPHMNALQPEFMRDPPTVQRWNAARRELIRQAAIDKGGQHVTE